jgi:hypothetical protein
VGVGVCLISWLSKCRYLRLADCVNISDVSALGNVTELSLSGCINVTDVSALGRVSTLNLSGCIQVRDVSKLGNVKKLNLSKCTLIRDVSSLGSVYDLNLSHFQGTDISALKNVKILNLSHSSFLSDLSALGNSIETINIGYCGSVSNVSMLRRVKILDITESLNIHDFSGLSSLQVITMSTARGHTYTVLAGFETFQQLKTMRMGMIQNTETILTQLLKVKSLQIENNFNCLSSLSFVTNLQVSSIVDDPGFQSLPDGLNHLLKLFISDCPQFTHIPELPRLEELVVWRCDGLTSFTILGTSEQQQPMEEVEFGGCKNLKTFIIQRRITRLIVSATLQIQNLHLVRNISHDGLFD